MNKQDLDTVELLEVAKHLGYFGYEVTAAEKDGDWYFARSDATWSFEFSRWRSFLCFRRFSNVKKMAKENAEKYLEMINRVQRESAVTQFSITDNDADTVAIHSWAMIPASYTRKTFSRNLLAWTRDLDRLQSVLEMASVD